MPSSTTMDTTYTLSPFPNLVIRDIDQAHIPFDLGNMDYQDYLAWLDQGNEPNPAPPSPEAAPLPQPKEVSVEQLVPPPAPPPSAPAPPPTTLAAPVKGGLAGI
jgi:hypothetical protein